MVSDIMCRRHRRPRPERIPDLAGKFTDADTSNTSFTVENLESMIRFRSVEPGVATDAKF